LTKNELIAAVREVMQDDKVVDALLRILSLPYAVKAAGEKAFLDEMTGPAVETVREALKMLMVPPERFVFEETEK
jgi:hypothetical protein